jgi:hypothetical protein
MTTAHRARQTARVETTAVRFSFLACLFLAVLLIASQSLYDSYIFYEEKGILPQLVGKGVSAPLVFLGVHGCLDTLSSDGLQQPL